MTVSAKCLLHSHKDLSLDSKHPYENKAKQCGGHCVKTPVLGGGGMGIGKSPKLIGQPV